MTAACWRWTGASACKPARGRGWRGWQGYSEERKLREQSYDLGGSPRRRRNLATLVAEGHLLRRRAAPGPGRQLPRVGGMRRNEDVHERAHPSRALLFRPCLYHPVSRLHGRRGWPTKLKVQRRRWMRGGILRPPICCVCFGSRGRVWVPPWGSSSRGCVRCLRFHSPTGPRIRAPALPKGGSRGRRSRGRVSGIFYLGASRHRFSGCSFCDETNAREGFGRRNGGAARGKDLPVDEAAVVRCPGTEDSTVARLAFLLVLFGAGTGIMYLYFCFRYQDLAERVEIPEICVPFHPRGTCGT